MKPYVSVSEALDDFPDPDDEAVDIPQIPDSKLDQIAPGEQYRTSRPTSDRNRCVWELYAFPEHRETMEAVARDARDRWVPAKEYDDVALTDLHERGFVRFKESDGQRLVGITSKAGVYPRFRRLPQTAPAPTLTSHSFKARNWLHPEENRGITQREAARIQSFDDEYRWCGSRRSIQKQISNAVPVQLAESIAETF